MKAPATLHEALRLAADLAEHNAQLEQALSELRMSNEYPEVLRVHHIVRLLETSKETVTEWARDPNFPVLNRSRKKGEAIFVLKAELYNWLRTRQVAN